MKKQLEGFAKQTLAGHLEGEIRHLAKHTWLPVLLLGPTGVGKSFWAKKIHQSSPRGGKPFVEVNCAALPPDLLEAELFGTENGAFTGAVKRPGKFEQANGGTLFLDEIGELPFALQAKLLLAVEAGQVTRLGAARPVQLDARVLYATQRDLPAEVRAGQFRADLYYRLAGYVLRLPALADCAHLIPVLARNALAELTPKLERQFRLSQGAVRLLSGVAWPGNIRELRHCVRQAALLASRQPQCSVVSQRHVKPFLPVILPPEMLLEPETSTITAARRWRSWSDAEFAACYQTWRAESWTQNRIAAQFGCDRTTLFRRVRAAGPLGCA